MDIENKIVILHQNPRLTEAKSIENEHPLFHYDEVP